MDTPYVRRLEKLDGSQVAVAGGKGASLGELVQAGMRVPPGFVITRAAFDAFMASADPEGRVAGWVADLDAGRLDVPIAARRVAEQLAPAGPPSDVLASISSGLEGLDATRVSVRSSATCEDGTASAWAGQLDTFLNVGPDDVAAQVRACWLSIFRPRALAYGAAHGYGAGDFAVAVVIQRMVPSEVSGIGFSVHPVTQEPDLRLIEACFGQGEAIVSGEIAPDQYVVERGAKRIIENTRGSQRKGLFLEPGQSEPVWRELGERGKEAKLDDDRILEYAGLLDRIEAHYGHPVDTEWALADGDFHLLQARPITTLAAEYRERLVDDSAPWARLVRRPLHLVEASLIAHWMDVEHAKAELGFGLDRHLAIQEASLTQLFCGEDSLQAAFAHIVELDRSDRPQLVGILKEGHEIYREGLARIERGEGFRDPVEAGEYFARIGRRTTGFPAWTLLALDAGEIDDPEVRSLAEGLRAHSLYPRYAHDLILPIVEAAARDVGFAAPERAGELMTWGEATGGIERETLEERLEAVRAGWHFVHQRVGQQEKVRFVSETGYLIMRLAGQRQIVPPDDPDRIAGQAAWPGVHRGRARVLLTSIPDGIVFEDGDVLVSPQSNPNMMPLLRHAGAIVTDDGGVACHAAIICRELKVPTLIGTVRATSAIHDGDLVEVDATEQVVRILERAS